MCLHALTSPCLCLRTDYFSVEKMRERAPFLYETSVVGSARVRPTRFPENLPLSERLLANIDSDRRAWSAPPHLRITCTNICGKVAARFEAQKQEDTQFAEQEVESDDSDKARSNAQRPPRI